MNVILILLISFAAYGLGNYALKFLKKIDLYGMEDFVLSTGLGLGIIAYIVLVIGQFGVLHFWVIALILALLLIFSSRSVFLLLKNCTTSFGGVRSNRFSKFEIMLLAILSFSFIFSLAGALSPPIGNDALAYHLYHPKIFIENQAIGFIPYERESLWPYLVEMLFTLGMLIKGAILGKLFHYLFGLLGTLAVFCLGRRLFNRSTGLIAAALFYLSPGILMQASYAYVDLALCFYLFCALGLFLLWDKHGRASLLVLSGVFAGLALSVKVLAVMGIIPLVMFLLFKTIRDRVLFNREGVLRFTAFLIPAFIFSFIWYLKSFIITGNPVYPFMYELFGSGWQDYHIGTELGYIRSFWGFLRLPWDMVVHYESFGGEQIGFLVLALLPCCIFANWKNRVNIYMAGFVLAYSFLWFKVDPNVRFLFPAVPVMFILISAGLYHLLFVKKFNLLKILVISGLVFNMALCLYYNVDSFKYISGRMDEASYLEEKERTYKAASWINKNTSENALILLATESRLYYFDRDAIRYKTLTKFYPDKKDRVEEITKISSEYNKIYILVTNNDTDDVIQAMIGPKIPVFTTSFTEDQNQFNYSIYES